MQGYYLRLATAGVALSLVFFSSTADAGSMRQVKLDSARIALGDLVPKAPTAIAALDLGIAPRPGKSKVIKASHIRKRLKQALISSKGLRIPHRTRVIRRSQTLTELELTKVMESQLPGLLPQGVRIQNLKVRGGLVLARGPVQVHWNKTRLRNGRQTLNATVQAGQSSPAQVIVAVELSQPKESKIILVKRGEPVMVRIRVGGVTIRAKATAQQDGRAGQVVAVLPVDGRKMIRGRVVDGGLVEVEL